MMSSMNSGVRLLACLLLVFTAQPCFADGSKSALTSGHVAAKRQWYEDEVYKEQWLSVPKTQRQKAWDILGEKSVVALSEGQVQLLLGIMPDIKQTLINLSLKTEKRALQLEVDTQNPLLEKYSQETRLGAIEARARAQFVSQLANRVKPFLVKARAHHDDEAGFSGRMERDVLKVVHTSMGCCQTETHLCPVVVFLEREPKEVQPVIITVK